MLMEVSRYAINRALLPLEMLLKTPSILTGLKNLTIKDIPWLDANTALYNVSANYVMKVAFGPVTFFSYRDWGDAKNVIKEEKDGLGPDNILSEDFFANKIN